MAQHHEIKISKEEIEKLYFDEKMTMKEIAEHFKCHELTIMRKMKKFGIKARVGGLYTRENLTGKEFNRCVVVKHEFDNKGYSNCVCKCQCGKEFDVLPGDLTCGRIKSCGNHRYDYKKGVSGEITNSYWNSLIKGAEERQIYWDLSADDAWEIFQQQEGKCALSGENICFVSATQKHKGKQTASLDRIDSSKGYTKDNIQWVHKTINLMKMKLKDEKFVMWCQKVSNFKKENKNE